MVVSEVGYAQMAVENEHMQQGGDTFVRGSRRPIDFLQRDQVIASGLTLAARHIMGRLTDLADPESMACMASHWR